MKSTQQPTPEPEREKPTILPQEQPATPKPEHPTIAPPGAPTYDPPREEPKPLPQEFPLLAADSKMMTIIIGGSD